MKHERSMGLGVALVFIMGGGWDQDEAPVGGPRVCTVCTPPAPREGALGLSYQLAQGGAKGRGEGRGLKAASSQHRKWGQTLSPMKIQRAGNSPPEKCKEPRNEPPAEW